MDSKPVPPPEAVLIRVAREAAGLTITEAARRVSEANPDASISTARWSQIEQGYEIRRGQPQEVRAKPGMLAQMAAVFHRITPERLAGEGNRPDAAPILAEIGPREETSPLASVSMGNGHTPPPPAEVTITLETVRAIVSMAVIETATAIRQHAEMILARSPHAAGCKWPKTRTCPCPLGGDIFPGEPSLAHLWDLAPSLSIYEKSRYAAYMRLGEEEQRRNSCA